MRVKLISMFLILLWITSGSLFSQDFTTEEEKIFLEESKVIAFAPGLDTLRLQPASMRAGYSPFSIDPTMTIEGIYQLPKPGNSSDEEILTEIYNLLNGVSTLKGIEYYSASREKMRTLFVESHRIENLETREAVTDLVYNQLPPRSSIFVAQEDKTFGKHKSRIDYQYKKPMIQMEIRNQTSMRVAMIPLLRPENFVIRLQILVEDDRVLLYGVMAAETMKLFGLEKSKEDSFYYRLLAITDWFEENYTNKILN